MRYMIAFTWKEFPDVSKAEGERLGVRTLIQEGKLEQMFLAEDRSKGWFIVLAEGEARAREIVLTLPFAPVMNLETTKLVLTYP